VTKSNVTEKAAVAKDEVDGEDGGDFELLEIHIHHLFAD